MSTGDKTLEEKKQTILFKSIQRLRSVYVLYS